MLEKGIEKMKGTLVAVEGGDGVGKSTFVTMLSTILESRGCHHQVMRFPDREGPIGSLIDAVLKGHTRVSKDALSLLFTADRADKREEIETLLENGVHVICDRYVDSGIIYSQEMGASNDVVHVIDKCVPCADMTVLIDGPAKSVPQAPEITEEVGLQEKVKERFRNAAGWISSYSVVRADSLEELAEEASNIAAKLCSDL